MKTFFDRFILSIPRLYIKQYPYAWIVFIALWTYPPSAIVFVFPFIILLGLFMLEWQRSAWLSNLRREHAPKGGKFYIDRPPAPLKRAVKRIAILLVAAGVISYFLNYQIGLEAWQTFAVVVGFSLLYRNSAFLGAPTTYVITASGIAIHFAPGHLDYRLFIKFNEINRIERCGFQKEKGWSCLARVCAGDGLLLIPKNPNGFTKRLGKIFVAPSDIERFQRQLSLYGLLAETN